MRHWTQDAVPGAAIVTLCMGIGAVMGGRGWPALGLAVTGAILLGVLRALETRDGFMQAIRAETNSQATQAELEAVKSRLAELEKPPLSARLPSRVGQGTPTY